MAKPTLFELLEGGRPVVGPGVYDALSARMAEQAGFSMAFLSGYCLSATQLAEPDFGLLTQTRVLEAADRICQASELALVVDIDTGYGGPFNVERTVGNLCRYGAAGCFLEDQVWPKRCGHMERKEVIELQAYLPKLQAALQARGDRPFHVTARTDARAVHGLAEAIGRGQAFAEAGADAVFIEAPQSVDELKTIARELPGVTLVANMVEQGKTPLLAAAELYELGFSLIASPLSGLLAATRALQEVFKGLRESGRSDSSNQELLRFDQLNDILGLPQLYERERAFGEPSAE